MPSPHTQKKKKKKRERKGLDVGGLFWKISG
jgi:hypothetical protein